MQSTTLLKRLVEIKNILQAGNRKKAQKLLEELIERINYEIMKEAEKEVDGKLLQHFMGWYLQIWENKPPEFFRYPKNWKDMVGKELKFVIKLYQNLEKDVEQIKADYSEFKKIPGKDKSLMFFRMYYLPSIDSAFKQEKKWTSKKFERGLEYYLQKEDLPI